MPIEEEDVDLSSNEFRRALRAKFDVAPEELFDPCQVDPSLLTSDLIDFVGMVAEYSNDAEGRQLAQRCFRGAILATGANREELEEYDTLREKFERALNEPINDILENLPPIVAQSNGVLPFIFESLLTTAHPSNQEILVRCLATARVPLQLGLLCQMFDDASTPEPLGWAIANTIYSTRNDVPTEWLLDRVSDLSVGREKEMLILTLGKRKVISAVPVLEGLIDEYPIHSAIALRKIGDPSALGTLIRKLPGIEGEARQEIRKAIEALQHR